MLAADKCVSLAADTSIVPCESPRASLTTREDLLTYALQVTWSEDRWRGSSVVLPDGTQVTMPAFVHANLRKPRPFHPEYALAIELLVAHAVAEAKRRGFRVAAVELGVWTYRTLTSMGKRVTKVGLLEPITLEDGRTQSRVGFIWVDHEQEGVSLRPWANGDQLIRLVDDRGRYYVPVDERTGDADSFKADTWRNVRHYPALDYSQQAIPLLDACDAMPLHEACEMCKVLVPLGSLARDKRARKNVCAGCAAELERVREEALAQGWDFDAGAPVAKPPLLVDAEQCEHRWGVQISGVEGEMSPGKIRHECILCGAPAPEGQ